MDSRMRASDAERNHTVTVLREEVGTGRLTLDEFSQRADAAYRSRTIGELATLTLDLPSPATPPAPPRSRRMPQAVVLIAIAVALAITRICTLSCGFVAPKFSCVTRRRGRGEP